jgi:anti-sigma regulatory factor (Ser/Thr protein kinase)
VSFTTTSSVAEFSINVDAEGARRASAWLEAAAIEQRVPREQITRLDQCLTEALANIITHGGPAARTSPVRLYLDAHIEPGSCQAAVTVSDSGVAFDPLAYEQKSGPQTLSEAEPGGLGLVMMRGFSDSMIYSYGEGRNQLTFRVFWAGPN